MTFAAFLTGLQCLSFEPFLQTDIKALTDFKDDVIEQYSAFDRCQGWSLRYESLQQDTHFIL